MDAEGTEMAIAPDKYAAVIAKIAGMTAEQKEARANELALTELTPETSQEFIKLLLGPDASFAE
jgi:hypothetical protein